MSCFFPSGSYFESVREVDSLPLTQRQNNKITAFVRQDNYSSHCYYLLNDNLIVACLIQFGTSFFSAIFQSCLEFFVFKGIKYVGIKPSRIREFLKVEKEKKSN